MPKKTTFLIVLLLLIGGCTKYEPVLRDKPWMSELPDDMRVCRMSIPGAHDAATGTMSIPIVQNHAKTQALTIAELWDAGVRAFDLRPALRDGELGIYHSSYYTGTTMGEALGTIASKLDDDPSEFAIILIRHEEEADGDDPSWGKALLSCIKSLPQSRVQDWFDPSMRLGDLRGRMLILSRESYSTQTYGAIISGWYSGTNLARQKSAAIGSGSLWVQDFYDPDSAEEKWSCFQSLAKDFTVCCDDTWCINHCSGYLSGTFGLPDYEGNASYINLKASQSGSSLLKGIIMMDFAGTDIYGSDEVHGATLVSSIISANFQN